MRGIVTAGRVSATPAHGAKRHRVLRWFELARKGAGLPRRDQPGQLATGGADWSLSKAAAFTRWQELCDRRPSRTESVRDSRGESPGPLGLG
jgi:hypothetical protein